MRTGEVIVEVKSSADAKMPSTASKSKKKKKSKKKGWLTAATADRHELYERAVQEPEAECDLIDQVWKEQRTRQCDSIREDFCGTAVVCAEWVKRRKTNTAVGVDLDEEVLDWGRARMKDRLTEEQRDRIQFRMEDVRTVRTEPVDSILAMNFSYFLFETRDELRAYFKHARDGLVDDGMLLVDAYGGSDSFLELEEDRDCDGFTYTWDQSYYNPITGAAVNHIHFSFPDGTKMKRAFTYRWRLWTLPEIQEILREAGFSDVVVYWEGTDEETEEGNGEWAISDRGEACPGWVAYLVAIK